MKIGLVIPALNSVEYIQKALKSVFLQEGNFHLHIHIQDGKSEDGTLDIINSFERKFLRNQQSITLSQASERDSSVPEALNRGFSHLDADVMGWLGSDDVLLPGAIASVASYIEQTKANWVTGLPTVIDTKGRLVALNEKNSPHRHPTGFARGLLSRGFHANGLIGGLQQEGTFWTRELWEQSGSYVDQTLNLAFDFELWCRLARYSEIVQLVAPLAAFRIRPGQLSNNTGLYRAEVGRVRNSLRSRKEDPVGVLKWRDFQRPIGYLSPNSADWETKRHTLGGKPFSRLTEKIFNALSGAR